MSSEKFTHLFALTGMVLLMNACSGVNSMEPFDDKQAAIVASSMLPSPLAKRHQLPVQRKTQQRTNQNDNGSKT